MTYLDDDVVVAALTLDEELRMVIGSVEYVCLGL
jgi:hypothetical protein